MTWEDELEATRAKVQSLGGCDTTDRDAAIFDQIDGLLMQLGNPDEIHSLVLGRYPPDIAPKGVPVLVAGGVAMKKTGGQWFTGLEEPLFQRPIEWKVTWWAPIPTSET